MARTAKSRDGQADDATPHRNEVRLVGRLSATARVLDLPSGDRLVTFRVIVDRIGGRRAGRQQRAGGAAPESGGGSGRRQVDTIDCATWTRREQRRVEKWQPGDLVEVQGRLRRRFRRGESGPVSRVEVEVTLAKKVG
jgi:single-strand DNA-binding protein